MGKCDLSVFETKDRIGAYRIGDILGEGQFADVKDCTHPDSPKTFAVKIMHKDKIHNVNALLRINNEISVLKKVRHVNIIKFHDVIISSRLVYLIVDKGGTDLFEFFDSHLDGVQFDDAREVICGIMRPINYLHSLGICHRDLKPENILLEVNGDINRTQIRICDFGLCHQNISPHSKTLSEFCGSPGFFAPEMILFGGTYNGLLVDIWSIGCIMLELCLGHSEFCSSWMTAYDYNSIQRESMFEDSITSAVERLDLSKLSKEMEDFLRKLLVINPDERLFSGDLLRHEWLDDEKSVMQSELGGEESKVEENDGSGEEEEGEGTGGKRRRSRDFSPNDEAKGRNE